MSKQKVAIIEDDPVISQMYRMKLELEGYEVQVAGNGVMGVELVEDFDPDIILLDVWMPEMNGDKALAKIRKTDKGKNTPVLVLTNAEKEEFTKTFQALGISDFIIKASSTPKSVVAKVKETLAS